jgi:hypothetical protein
MAFGSYAKIAGEWLQSHSHHSLAVEPSSRARPKSHQMAPAQSLYFKNLLMLAGLSLIFTPENVTDP